MKFMPHHNMSRIFASLVVLLLPFGSPAAAQEGLDLQLSGAIDAVNLSLDDLDAMEQVTLETSTIWTDGVNTFSGVSLKALLEAHNADGTSVEMIALNDYSVSMPIAELEDDAPIIATRMDGDTMSVRDKGPYWVVFPYDSATEYQSEIVYSRSIWQLNRLMVIKE
jgi:hypothetical protein